MAKAIVGLRFVLVPLWVALAALAVAFLPSIGQGQSGPIGELIPEDAPAVRAEILSKQQFPFLLITRTLVVHHDEDGLPPGTLREAAQTARDVREARPTTVLY